MHCKLFVVKCSDKVISPRLEKSPGGLAEDQESWLKCIFTIKLEWNSTTDTFGRKFFWIVLYISDGDRFVHFFVLRLFYHSNLDSYNEELMIVHSVLFMGDASIQYSLLITKILRWPEIEPGFPAWQVGTLLK